MLKPPLEHFYVNQTLVLLNMRVNIFLLIQRTHFDSQEYKIKEEKTSYLQLSFETETRNERGVITKIQTPQCKIYVDKEQHQDGP